jgi:hypothetical protein
LRRMLRSIDAAIEATIVTVEVDPGSRGIR